MYEKSNIVPLASNASFIHKNLTILKAGSTSYAAVSKNAVNLTVANRSGTELDQKQIMPKIAKDELSALADGTENMLLAILTQCQFVEVAQRIVLVICATKGIFFFDEDGTTLLYYHALRQNIKALPIEETTYGRGIAVVGSNLIAIGTSVGSILFFEVAPKGNKIVLVQEHVEKVLNAGITDLISSQNVLCAADTNGNIFAWSIKSEHDIKILFVNRGNKNSCTALGIWRGYLIATYGNGLVSIFTLDDGKKVADISAHARWIHCIDVAEDKFVTASQDGFFRVFELAEISGRLKVNALHSELIPDTLICGIKFSNGTEQICVSSFDNNEIIVYNSL